MGKSGLWAGEMPWVPGTPNISALSPVCPCISGCGDRLVLVYEAGHGVSKMPHAMLNPFLTTFPQWP